MYGKIGYSLQGLVEGYSSKWLIWLVVWGTPGQWLKHSCVPIASGLVSFPLKMSALTLALS